MNDPGNPSLPHPGLADPRRTASYSPLDSAAELCRVLDLYLADLQAGRAPDRAALLNAHPELAAQLEQCLGGIEFIHRAARPSTQAPAQLGDFRILREIGRGGMGVVYEAEQLSLKRRVALKVLRFGAVADPEVMQRFQREAETVARLHHTNIVPIFAIGCDQGVHYYAMQYIEGRSLAAVLAASEAGVQAIAPADLAGWGLQAAEALAHAHQRGVVHRDVKPSNLLLDAEGTLWLTDFGLAKRVDEVTLTQIGVLLGTPRYMSPEQASGLQQPVDERTDIYSLGATLYELATGRPVFDADTPQGVLEQILHAEPVAPRRLERALPRDLETIILKCLAKEPARRYPAARALAEDLRAFLDGRAITARRPSLAERTLRWARQQRRSVTVAAVTAAAALLLMAGTLLTWNWYAQWRLGQIFVKTEGPALVAEVLAAGDQLVADPFTVPTQRPVALRAGTYDLRLAGRGRLGETLHLVVERGMQRDLTVALDESLLWPPLAVSRTCEVVDLAGRADVLLVTDKSLRRLDGATAKPVWDVSLHTADQPDLAGIHWDGSTKAPQSGKGPFDHRPQLLRPAPDLNGDGVRDLVWACRHQAALLAISGQEGKVLWCFQARPSVARSTVLGTPVVMDVNGDGTPDLIITCASRADAAAPPGQAERWVEAVSGRTGQSLWSFALDRQWFARPGPTTPSDQTVRTGYRNELVRTGPTDVPFDSRWFPSPDTQEERLTPWTRRAGTWEFVPYAAQVIQQGNRPRVVVAAGTHLLELDVATGQPLRPAHDFGYVPVRAPQFADLDGDGQAEALLLRAVPTGGLTLTVLALTSQQLLWEAFVAADWGWHWYEPPVEWPLLADLDGDGRLEVIVPYREAAGDQDWHGLTVRAGASGHVRWQRRLAQTPTWQPALQLNRFVLGPDLDGDGRQEVFVAAVSSVADRPPEALSVFIDALSGQDGHPLWWWRHALPEDTHAELGPLRWWQADRDGWPQLVVSYVPCRDSSYVGTATWRGAFSGGFGTYYPRSRGLPTTFVLAAATGRLRHTGLDLAEPQIADLNGDSLPDLYAFRPEHPDRCDGGGQLTSLRGRSPGIWRRPGTWQPAEDLDGDGRADLMNVYGRTKVVLSGQDAHTRWQAEGDVYNSGNLCLKLPHGDLDGDGLPDILAFDASTSTYGRGQTPLEAFSGKTGRSLWRAAIQIHGYGRMLYLGCDNLDGAGEPEILLVASMDWSEARPASVSNIHGQWWLAVLSGRTGKVRWKQPASILDIMTLAQWKFPLVRPVLADVDGDGVRDLVLATVTTQTTLELCAFGGRDGRVLWRTPLATRANVPALMRAYPYLAAGDLDGDGQVEIVVVTPLREAKDQGKQPTSLGEVLALKGRTGRVTWTWQGEINVAAEPVHEYLDRKQEPGMPLLVNLQGDRRRAICLWGGPNGQIVVLAAGGQVLSRAQISQTPKEGALRVWGHDVDGDGREELLFFTQRALRVTRAGVEQVLWEWPLPEAAEAPREILGLPSGGQEVVVVRAGNVICGLAGSTGQERWRGEGPGQFAGLLRAHDPQGLPWTVFHLADPCTICRLPLWKDPSGGYQPPQSVPQIYGAVPADPRLGQRVPWREDRIAPFYGYAIGGAVLGVVLLVIPGGLLGWAVRRRSWRLGLLPAFWLGGVVGLSFLLSPSPPPPEAPAHIALGLMLGLPNLAFVGRLIYDAVRRRWRRLGLLLALCLALAVLIGLSWSWHDAHAADPSPQHAAPGWHTIAFFGIYAAGVILLLELLVRRVMPLLWARGSQELLPAKPA